VRQGRKPAHSLVCILWPIPSSSQPMSFNGAAVVAMAGKNCVAIAR
jgi:hypothetical protein